MTNADIQYGVRYENWEIPCSTRTEAEQMTDEAHGVKLIARPVIYGDWEEK